MVCSTLPRRLFGAEPRSVGRQQHGALNLNEAIFAATALLLASAAGATSNASGSIRANIVYGSYSGLSLLMDAHVPAKPNGLALLHIPGSGFQAPLGMEPYEIKDPGQHQVVLTEFLAQGFTVFTINHRAAPRFPYPGPLEDVQRASRFIRAHAAEYKVSAEWLGAVGGSSGGNLALMLGTVGDGAADQPKGPAPQCVVAAMPPTDLLPLGQDGPAVGMATQYAGTVAPFSEEAIFPGYAERLAPYLEASPITHLNSKIRTRFLLVHGDADTLVPLDQSKRFEAKARAAGVHVELRTMAGVGHTFPAAHAHHAALWMSRCAAKTSATS